MASSSSPASASASPASSSASASYLRSYLQEGYVVLREFASSEEVSKLRSRASEIMLAFSSSSEEEEDGSAPHVFTTRDNKQSTTSDDYFLSSAHKVSCFLEEDAVDAEGNILVPQIDLAINKIGHAMHDVDSVFREFSRSDKIKQVCRTVGVKNATPVQVRSAQSQRS